MATVTIGIPVYNESQYLDEAIHSAISQTLTDIEIIISDNASTDASYEIAQKYASKDSRIRVVEQDMNIGPMNNFRYLLDAAASPYFAWLGGHDLFENDYLELAIKHMESNKNVVMTYPANAVIVDTENKPLPGKACSSIETAGIGSPLERVRHIIENLSICTNIHGLYRTDVLKKLPFEKTFGPDFLMLTMTGLYGDIASIDTTGIRRRKIREETREESLQRWEEIGIFSRKEKESPYARLVDLHLSHIKISKEVQFMDYFKNSRKIRKTLYKKFGAPK